MITHSRVAEIRRKLFGCKNAKRPKPPNEAERLYLGAARVYADTFREVVSEAIAETYPELLDPKNVRSDGPGVHVDARVGPLMLGKRASKVLAHITNPLREAADRIPLGQVAGTVKGHVERDVQRYMPGLKNTDLFLGSQVAEWRRTNVELITGMQDDSLERIGALLEDYDGLRVEDTATTLEDIFDLTRARAELIARDQVLKLNGNLNQEAQQRAGVDKYRWSTSHDGSVRDDPKGRGDPNHADLDNTVHSWDDPPVTCERTGATNHPGQDYQCRCVAIPVLEEFDDESWGGSEALDGEWDESLHPRAENGQFGEGGGTQHTGGLQITNPDKVQSNARAIFGRDLGHDDVKNLLGVHTLDIPGAHTTEYVLRPHGSDGLHYEAHVKDSAGKTLLQVKRQIETNWESGKREVEVHHDLMVVAEHLQGEGLGSKLFDAQLKAYQARGGLDRITTSATWVGTYQWPALGFSHADESKFGALKSEARSWLNSQGKVLDDKSWDKVKNVHDLARLSTKTERLGKALLIARGKNESAVGLELKFDLGSKSKELKAYAKSRKAG